MDFALTADQERIREVSRALAVGLASRAAKYDRDGSSPLEDYAALRDAGLYALVVPREFGGWGSGFLGYTIAAEELAQGSPATALSYNMHCVALLILLTKSVLSTERKRWVAELAVERKQLICALLSEPGTTGLLYSTRACGTRVRRTPEGHVLNGKKAFCSMVEASDYGALFACPEGASRTAAIPVLFPLNLKGLRIERVWDTLGMRATRSDNLILEDCLVPSQGALEEVFFPDIGDFVRDYEPIINLPYTATYLGVGLAALNAAAAAVKQRVPKGYRHSLAYHPDVRRRIGTMSAQLEAARHLLYYAAWLIDIDAPLRDQLSAFLQAKYVVGEAVAGATRSALEIGGGHALFKGSTIERLFRDGATATIMQPPSDVCLGQIGTLALGLEPSDIPSPLLPVEAEVARK